MNSYVISNLDQKNVLVRKLIFFLLAFFISSVLDFGLISIPVLSIGYILFTRLERFADDHSFTKIFYWYLGIRTKKLQNIPNSSVRVLLG